MVIPLYSVFLTCQSSKEDLHRTTMDVSQGQKSGTWLLGKFQHETEKRKLKFPLKKKEEKCRLCFSQQYQMLGGIASRRQVMKVLWFSMKKEREKFPRNFFS